MWTKYLAENPKRGIGFMCCVCVECITSNNNFNCYCEFWNNEEESVQIPEQERQFPPVSSATTASL
jgi:hypothetical protein